MQPILVTGAHRSGTTWVGRMIAATGQARYVHEPFHISFSKRGKIEKWFQYIYKGWENEADAKLYLHQKYFLEFPEVLRRIKRIKDIDDVSLLLKDSILKVTKKPPVIKDPISLFSLEWIEENFGPKVVITVRHPAAFVGSLKASEWHFPFKDLASQPKLMEELPEYAGPITSYAEFPPDIIDQAILLWNIFHSRILKYKEGHPDWYYIQHEKLSLNPVEEFEKMMTYLGLDFNDKVKAALTRSTSGEKHDKTHRDSKANIYTWKERLTPSEISKVKDLTGEVSSSFYAEGDW